jgi:hypothetical protein
MNLLLQSGLDRGQYPPYKDKYSSQIKEPALILQHLSRQHPDKILSSL